MYNGDNERRMRLAITGHSIFNVTNRFWTTLLENPELDYFYTVLTLS